MCVSFSSGPSQWIKIDRSATVVSSAAGTRQHSPPVNFANNKHEFDVNPPCRSPDEVEKPTSFEYLAVHAAAKLPLLSSQAMQVPRDSARRQGSRPWVDGDLLERRGANIGRRKVGAPSGLPGSCNLMQKQYL